MKNLICNYLKQFANGKQFKLAPRKLIQRKKVIRYFILLQVFQKNAYVEKIYATKPFSKEDRKMSMKKGL